PFDPLVVYLPEIPLQSAWPVYEPSVLDTRVQRGWSSAGITPWNAGTFSVTAVSCQVLPVSALVPDAEHATRDAAIANRVIAIRTVLRMGLLKIGGARSSLPRDVNEANRVRPSNTRPRSNVIVPG